MNMCTKFKSVLLASLLLSLCACEPIRDGYGDCGVWLEFIFDYNMEFADSFDSQVSTVDVFFFDKSGRFVMSEHAGIDELEGRKRMFIGNDIPFGEYRVLTVGNLSAPFGFTHGGGLFTPGVTTMADVALALNIEKASQEFTHLFFGTAVEVGFKADLSVWPVPLIRETNRFHVMLRTLNHTSADNAGEGAVDPQHTVEIIAPETGAYNHLNNPVRPGMLVYRPYSLRSRLDYTEEGVMRETAAHLNTMRLLGNEWDGYRIIVRDIASGKELWSNDLLSLLAATQHPPRPDGSYLPQSEYFDREGEWNIVIVYKYVEKPVVPADPKEGFTALKIIVNDWIIWETGAGV